MTEELVVSKTAAEEVERVLINGDVSRLSPEQKIVYYRAVCERVGLDPLLKPFDFLQLSGKLVLYANKNATEQLRRIHGVSVYKIERERMEDAYAVTAYGRDAKGREDTSLGVVNITGMKGDVLANAMMKAETKAKRRLTLSMCGLGMLDETEVETIPGAVKVTLEPAKELVQPDPFEGVPATATATAETFLKEFEADSAKAANYVELAVLCRQYVGIANKLGVYGSFMEIKRKRFGQLMASQDDQSFPSVDIPNTVHGDYFLEFYAMEAVGRKSGYPGMKTFYAELLPLMKEANLANEWKAYAAAVKKELVESAPAGA